MSNRVAIITGASRGIGKAIALKFASQNIDVVINYSGSEPKAKEVAIECEKKGVVTLVVQADVSKFEECKKLVDKTIEKFGRVDILVNNAGITRDNLAMRMSEDDFDLVIDTNLKSVFNCCKLVARPMMKNRFGRIINMSSIVGVIGNSGQVNYSASKAGVIGITKSLARELGSRNITVNAVAPGFIKTDMTENLSEDIITNLSNNIPLGYLGEVEDIANAVGFLASDDARYITGEVIKVTGGMGM